ncbi:hypothetical protein [Nakamurella aerolata]|uniref:Glycosyl hydrolase family 32 n=1 Tax=Nakamurella aerolata TaxID=1656892 RepID=A0A849A778_9ACTN|nr:hypothetical protein [Nakamurella aerolata]NNG35486.1 hypothetical protein [Nakamurella aerolata]
MSIPLTPPEQTTVVVPAPASGEGNWSGAASAAVLDGRYWLTWRERRPLHAGRGVAAHVAVSSDGVNFETEGSVTVDDFPDDLRPASLERPALVRLADGRLRLYLSCATRDSKHWWIEARTAATARELASTADRLVVLPGSDEVGVKDPVIWHDGTGWLMLVTCHPLDIPDAEDRMTTRLYTSADGLGWSDRGDVLAGRPGAWDEHGARATAVLPPMTQDAGRGAGPDARAGAGHGADAGDPAGAGTADGTETLDVATESGVGAMPPYLLYDGRPDAESNWEETTGLARWDGRRYASVPFESGMRAGAGGQTWPVRHVSVVAEPGGGLRFYAEAPRPDGAHDLVSWTAGQVAG